MGRLTQILCSLAIVCAHATRLRQKVYSVGDLHGDYDHFKLILQQTGLATFEDGKPKWTGGDTILVSTGDSVDRGVHAKPIYKAFQALAKEAPKHGGEVVNIVGNHELMNLQGDLRYVHPQEYENYGGQHGRQRDWSKDGLIGGDVRNRFVSAVVREGTLFVHGGMDPDILRKYGSGTAAIDGLNAAVRKLFDTEVVSMNHKLFGQKGPFWNRFFAEAGEAQVCKKVADTLQLVGAERMVIGHTPQEQGVNVRCSGKLGPRIIMADTVISRAYEDAFGFTRPSAVEFDGDSVTALYFKLGQQEVKRAPVFDGDHLEM